MTSISVPASRVRVATLVCRAGKVVTIVCLAGLVATGCARAEPLTGAEFNALLPHVLALDGAGRILPCRNGLEGEWPCPKDERGLDVAKSLTAAGPTAVERTFTRFVEAFAASDQVDLLFFFNGGLNPVDSGLRRANTLHDRIERDTLHDSIDRDPIGFFPMFMIWSTGPFDTYFEQVLQVSNGRYHDDRHWWMGGLTIVGDLIRGIGGAPAAWAYNTKRFWDAIWKQECEFFVVDASLDSDPRAQGCADKNYGIHHRPAPGASSGWATNLIFSDEINEEPSRGADAARLALTTPPRTVLVPFVEGLGQEAWSNMVRRTKTTIRSEGELTQSDAVWALIQKRYPHGTGGFAQYFALLQSCVAPVASTVEPICPIRDDAARSKLQRAKITLVGHSMGAIVVNELVRAFPNLEYRNIVFMAGAASIGDTVAAIEPLLSRRAGQTYFFNLALHPMNEARELHYWGAVPSGSLLVWIDEMLERPGHDLDRTIGQWSNVQRGRRVFSQAAREWMHFKVFDWTPRPRTPECPADARSPTPTEHGEFDQTCPPYFWHREFWSSRDGTQAGIVRFSNEPVPAMAGGAGAETPP